MKKKNFAKKALAAVVSAATLFSCSAVSSLSSGIVTAEGSINYADALALSLYFFDANQCGDKVDDNCLTWRGNCHTYDAEASLDNANNLDSSLRSIVDPDGDGKVDVSGGYHDAGDHVKFNLTMGFAASSLGLSSYLNPGVYKNAGCEDHLKEIIRNTADYMMKTTFLDDSGNVAAICATVSNQSDHSMWTAPETQNYSRPTYWLTASKNNSVISATMSSAFSSAAYIFKDSDPAYSAECLKYAKALLDFTVNHPEMSNDPNSGMYSTSDTYVDDLCLAQVWLYINGAGDLPNCKPNGDKSYTYNGQKYYDYYLYSWDKVWSGYSAIMYKITGEQCYADEVKNEIQGQGGLPTSSYNGNGWGASRYNCALQFCGIATGDKTLIEGAKFQMDHILGNNSRGYSFLLGYGDKWPTHIHHRAANPGENNQTSVDNPDSKYVLYGALVGGDDSSGNYEDHSDRYQFTEPALDYNACFALACASLCSQYGDETDEINSIITEASEIDENYVFGKSDNDPIVTTEPETTEPPTTTTTTIITTVIEPATEPVTEPATEPETTEAPTDSPTFCPTEIVYAEYGDVNCDGEVTISDVVNLNMYLLNAEENPLNSIQIMNADCVRDGVINTSDSALIMNYVAMTVDIDELGK